ncbi:sigma-70 family RNA polymerase sigma factor [Catenulispora rubra]|uniref:sigma-70 family RNA polymerase sigma factor n=1 Tax=Catenulispora rubra TaxID=280293 RepID=UPI00189272D2|nr:sigma-70 family RNA polymerase sigma factor [Catenulispora rubra]
MIVEVDADMVVAARDGDAAAIEQLIVDFLPLVYNIIGRGLGREFDVDDAVQETMLHVMRGLPELRDPAAFRSWLVAIAMNEIRKQHHRRLPESRPLDEFDALVEPVSDFTDQAIWQLGLTGQRRETAKAAEWLDDHDRELLSLWVLAETGLLSRAEMIGALDVGPHAVTVRIGRMKAQLETARGIVRALAGTPPCRELSVVAMSWSGAPHRLWRKRFARHIRECDLCMRAGADLIPAEHLLVGLALVPVPFVLARKVSSATRRQAARTPISHRRVPRAAHKRIPGRSSMWSGKVALIGATVVVGGGATVVGSIAASSTNRPVAESSTARHQLTTSNSPTPTRSPATPPASPTTPTITPKPTPQTPSGSTSSSSAGDQVLAVINNARRRQGLPPLTRTDGLNRSSSGHNQAMLSGCGLNHDCPGEPDFGGRESAAGVSWSAAGENIGAGTAALGSPSSISNMAVLLTDDMIAEKPPNDGHRANILSTAFHHVGISVSQDASGTVWLTQDFSD